MSSVRQPIPEPEPERSRVEDIDTVPRTELARKILENRRRYIAAGGPLYSREEALRALREWNGETDDDR